MQIGNGIYSIKKKFIILICLFLVIINYLLVLNICSKDIVREEYIDKEIKNNVSVLSILYSSKFDENEKIKKLRDNIEDLYSINEFLNIDRNEVDKIVESDIFKEVLVKISMNIINSIKDNRDYLIFDINDYNSIIDNNIDSILDNLNIELFKNNKAIITTVLKKIGEKTFNDGVSTSEIKKSIPKYKLSIIYIITNENIRFILIVLDIIFILILLILESNSKVLLTISKIMLYCIILFIITNIYLNIYTKTFIDEWTFVRRIIYYYNYNIIQYEIIFGTLMLICISSYIIIKAYKEK